MVRLMSYGFNAITFYLDIAGECGFGFLRFDELDRQRVNSQCRHAS